MATVTIGGGGSQTNLPQTQVLVTTLLNINQLAGRIAVAALTGINSDSTPGAVTVIGGSSGTNGPVTISSIPPNLQAIVVENNAPTTISNIGTPTAQNNETIFSGVGGLTFYDYNTNDTIVTGGGNNNITFSASSFNGIFSGDGNNTVHVNTTNALGVTTVVGTASSSDTVIGSTTPGGGIDYIAAFGSTAFIDPGAHNATVLGAAGATETVSVFGGVPFTGTLTVINGTGYFKGGSAGDNSLTSSTVGSTTLIGGGSGDTLTAFGTGDSILGGIGSETLQSAASLGGVAFAPTAPGNGYTTTILMHVQNGAGSNSVIGSAANETVVINDFIAGTDKLKLTSASSVTGISYSGGNTTITTANGSTFTFNGAILHSSDIVTRG